MNNYAIVVGNSSFKPPLKLFFDPDCRRFFQSGQFLRLLYGHKIQDEDRTTDLQRWHFHQPEYSNAGGMFVSRLCSC